MEKILKLENISVEFGGRLIINRLNYIFNEGIYVIKGRSGVGKTTLLNIIANYIEPKEGHVYKNSMKVGYCFQEDLMFENLTVEENMYIKYRTLNSYKGISCSVIDLNLEKFGIIQLKKSKVYMLSGGEKQRLKMAMLSMDEPDIILLDEPTSMLDDNNKIQMIRAIENNWTDKIIIIVTHDDLRFTQDVKYLKFGGV